MSWWMPGMQGMHATGFMWMGYGSVLVWFLVIGAVVAITLLAVRQPLTRSTAREVLDQRYARGDIDDEEYRRRLRGLAG